MWYMEYWAVGKWVKGQSSGNPWHLGTTGDGDGNVHTQNFINIIVYNQNIESYTTVTMSYICLSPIFWLGKWGGRVHGP